MKSFDCFGQIWEVFLFAKLFFFFFVFFFDQVFEIFSLGKKSVLTGGCYKRFLFGKLILFQWVQTFFCLGGKAFWVGNSLSERHRFVLSVSLVSARGVDTNLCELYTWFFIFNFPCFLYFCYLYTFGLWTILLHSNI